MFKLNFESQLDVLVSPVDCLPKPIVLITITHAMYLFVSFLFLAGGVGWVYLLCGVSFCCTAVNEPHGFPSHLSYCRAALSRVSCAIVCCD